MKGRRRPHRVRELSERNVAHERIGERVGQTGQRAQQSHQRRVHAQAQVQDDHHSSAGGRQQIVDEGARTVSYPVGQLNLVFRRGFVMCGGAHEIVSFMYSCLWGQELGEAKLCTNTEQSTVKRP